MKTQNIRLVLGITCCFSLLISENYTAQQKQELGQKALYEMLQKIYSETMAAKRAFLSNQLRDEAIQNFATTAPRIEFIVNADISEELAWCRKLYCICINR